MNGDNETSSELVEKPLEWMRKKTGSAHACARGGEAPPRAQLERSREGKKNASESAGEKESLNADHSLESHIRPEGRECRSLRGRACALRRAAHLESPDWGWSLSRSGAVSIGLWLLDF